MTLQEEVELLERKVAAMKELKALEGYPQKLNINPLIKQWPSRLNDVDPILREHMMSPSCTYFS